MSDMVTPETVDKQAGECIHASIVFLAFGVAAVRYQLPVEAVAYSLKCCGLLAAWGVGAKVAVDMATGRVR